ncbi:hypothetical protein CAJAP_00451 [Camponotus japonicus]
MASQMQLIFILAIIELVYGKSVAKHSFLISVNGEEKKVVLDEKIDELLPAIREFILINGLDPTQLGDYSESIFPNLPRVFKGSVDLKKGWLQNLSTIKRTNHIIGIYKDKLLTIDMNLGFDVLDCSYEYYFKYLFFTRHGDVFSRFYDLDINVVLTIDLANYYVELHSIKFSNIRKYDIKFEGHILDRLLNILVKAVTVIFRKCVMVAIEERSIKIFGAKIDEWNNSIPRPNYATLPIIQWFDDLNAQLN